MATVIYKKKKSIDEKIQILNEYDLNYHKSNLAKKYNITRQTLDRYLNEAREEIFNKKERAERELNESMVWEGVFGLPPKVMIFKPGMKQRN